MIGHMVGRLVGHKGLAVGCEGSSMIVERSCSGRAGLKIRVWALLPRRISHSPQTGCSQSVLGEDY